MRKITILAAFLGLAFASCNKNQKAVKNLEGNWNITSFVDSYAPDEVLTGTMQFESCKLKEEDCGGSLTLTDGTDASTIPFQYSISEQGNEMFLTYLSTEDESRETYDCSLDLDGDNATIEYIDTFGDKITIDIAKQ